MAQLQFDARNVAPDTGVADAIPAGWYKVAIDESEMKPTKDGQGAYLNVRYNILDGSYAGRKVFGRLNLRNANPVAQEIAYKQLSAICHAVGRLTINDSAELHGQPMQIKVKFRKADADYEASNDVAGWKNINEVVGVPGAGAPGAGPSGVPAGFGAPAGFAPQPQFQQPAAAAPQQQQFQQPQQQQAPAGFPVPQQQFQPAPTQAPAGYPAQQQQFQQPAQQPQQQQFQQQQAPAAAPAQGWQQPTGEQPWGAAPVQQFQAQPQQQMAPMQQQQQQQAPQNPAVQQFAGAVPPWQQQQAPQQ